MSAKETLPGLRRGIQLLEAMSEITDGMTFNDVKDLFQEAPPSTISRLLKALQAEDLIQKNEFSRNYQLTAKARYFGEKLCGKVSRSDLLRPLIKELADETGHSAGYFELIDNKNSLVAKHEIAEAFHYMAEGSYNVNFDTHGCAKLIIAYQDDIIRSSIINSEPFQKRLKEKPLDLPKYKQDLDKIKKDGYYINLTDDYDYIARFAAPIFQKKQFIGSLGITVIGLDKSNTNLHNHLIEKVINKSKQATQLLSER